MNVGSVCRRSMTKTDDDDDEDEDQNIDGGLFSSCSRAGPGCRGGGFWLRETEQCRYKLEEERGRLASGCRIYRFLYFTNGSTSTKS